MRGPDLAEAMASAVDRIVSAHEGTPLIGLLRRLSVRSASSVGRMPRATWRPTELR